MEGLTFDGEPATSGSDVNTDAGFNAALAAQAATSDQPAGDAGEQPAETPAAAPVDPARQSREDIYAGLLDPNNSPALKDGLTVREPVTPETDPASSYTPERAQEILGLMKQHDAAEAQRSTDQYELEYRRFQDVWSNPDASDVDKLTAAMTLREKAPEAYETFVVAMDEEPLRELHQLEADGYEMTDEDFANLPGEHLSRLVEIASDGLKSDLYQGAAEKIWTDEIGKRATAITDAYAKQGITEPAQLEHQWGIDMQAIASVGQNPATMDAEALTGALEFLGAARQEAAKVQATNEFHKSFFDGRGGGDLREGLVVDGRPVQPRPDFNYLPEDFGDRALARALRGKAKETTTKGEFRNRIANEGGAHWKDGLTTRDGTPLHVDEVTGARERFEREQKEARLKAMGLLK